MQSLYLLTPRRCHPQYLSNRAHHKFSQVGAFDGLRIHTDELQEVICRIAPGSLSHAVVSVPLAQPQPRLQALLTIAIKVMDSMDWFSPHDSQAITQVQALHRALKTGGKVLLRSAGLKPWYTTVFEKNGFATRRVGARMPGTCIDR